MSKQTFNPISEPFNSFPRSTPGTVVVQLKNGQITEVTSSSIAQNVIHAIGHAGFPLLAGVGTVLFIGLIISGLLFGKWFVLILLILAVSIVAYVALNRESSAARAILGVPATFYLVNVAKHRIVDTRRCQLKNVGVFVIVDIEYNARVTKACDVVKAGVKDVGPEITSAIYQQIDKITSEGSLTDKLESMRKSLKELSGKITGYQAFAIDNVILEVRLEEELQSEVAKIEERTIRKESIEATNVLNTAERRYIEPLLMDKVALIAELIREKNKDSLIVAIRELEKSDQNAFNKGLALFSTAIQNGVIEPHHFDETQKQALKNWFSESNLSVMGSPIGLTKPAIERKDDGEGSQK